MALFGRETARDQQRVEAYREWFQRQHPLALAAVVLSVFSLTHFGTLWVDEIAGIVLGVAALMSLRRNRNGRSGDLIAYLAIAIGLLSLTSAVLIYFVLPIVRAG